jgi:hypothetical protein
MAPDGSMNPSRTSANAAAGRRGAWLSTGARRAREILWTTPQTRTGDAQQQPAAARDTERVSRRSSRALLWIAVLIAIASAFLAVMLATSSD